MAFYVFRRSKRDTKRAILSHQGDESITSRNTQNMLKNLDIHVGGNYIF